MGTGASLAGVLNDITYIISSAIGWMGSYMDVIADNPLLLVFITLPIVGLGICLIRRMINL